MIEVKITEQMKRRAWKKAREMGKLKNSITKGAGNIAAFLGEEVANVIIKGVIENTYDYDIIDSSGITYDVKTKRCTSEPKPEYECSVANFNTKQNCSRYVFVRIENINGKWGRAWVLGYMPKEEYFQKAKKLTKGQRDGSNWFKVKSDCYNVRIDELYNFGEIKC